MKFLLDTHIWLWSLGEPDKLSGRVAKELDSRENELWLSPISIWEAFLLLQEEAYPDFHRFCVLAGQ